MTNREHVFFILGFAQGDLVVIENYLRGLDIDKSVLAECNEDLKAEGERRRKMTK